MRLEMADRFELAAAPLFMEPEAFAEMGRFCPVGSRCRTLMGNTAIPKVRVTYLLPSVRGA